VHDVKLEEAENSCGMAFPTQRRGFPTLLHKFVSETSKEHPEVVHWSECGDVSPSPLLFVPS